MSESTVPTEIMIENVEDHHRRWADVNDDSDHEDSNCWQKVKVQSIETKEDMITVLTQIEPENPATVKMARRLCMINGMSDDETKRTRTEL